MVFSHLRSSFQRALWSFFPPKASPPHCQNEHDCTHARFSTYTNEGTLLNAFSKKILKSDKIRQLSFDLIQSCLGLICLRARDDGSILVCNPSTEEIITLPEVFLQKYDKAVRFGYASSTKEFKVVKYHGFGNDLYCHVITLGSNAQWRHKPLPPCMPLWEYMKSAPLLNGALHITSDFYTQNLHITAFDLDSEEYREIPLPEINFNTKFSNNRIQLTELGGSLCLTFNFIQDNKTLELWLLKDYHSRNWVKEYIIDFPSAADCVLYLPIAILGDGNILLLDGWNDELLCYNTREMCFAEKIGVNCSALLYIESFLPLGSK